MTRYFAEVDPNGRLLQVKVTADEEPSPPAEGNTLVEMARPVEVGWDAPSPTHVLQVADGAAVWVDHGTIHDQRRVKAQAMSDACALHIMAGFDSAALGSTYRYPAQIKDQINLTASVTDSLMATDPAWTTPFWCCDEVGAWDLRPHTAAQIQHAGRDGKAAIAAAIIKNEALLRQIETATAAQLQDIHWDTP